MRAGEVDAIPIFSFDRGATNCVLNAPNFTYIVASDPQLWWWTRDDREGTKKWGDISNAAQVAFYNNMAKQSWSDGTGELLASGCPAASVDRNGTARTGPHLHNPTPSCASERHLMSSPFPLGPP